MFHRDIFKKMQGETSGARALEYLLRFWVHDRLSTFPGYQRAAESTKQIMEEIGLKNVKIHRYPTTGKNLFADWEGPQGWDAISGTLDVKGGDGKLRRIADRQADPCHLMLWCGSTPPKGVRTKIVYAKSNGSLKGKLVFQDKVALDDKLRKKLIQKGALGVISDEFPYWPEVREREQNMELVRWHNAFLFPQNNENLLAFSIKPVDGDWLRSQLAEKDEVEAFTRVQTKLYDDTLPVTTGVIPGTDRPDQEVWFIQHLHEIGAHDNATGVATALEAVRALIDMVNRGELEAPRKTIRVICSWEVIGFLAHLCANPKLPDKVICAFNPDMVGPDIDRCKSWMQVYVEPHSNPSYIDDLTIDLTRTLFKDHPRWHWETHTFMINDNFLADPSIDIPCTSLIFMRDRHYHTSSDRPENLSPLVMGEMAALLAAGAYTVTNGGEESALQLADLIHRGILEELAELASAGADSVKYDERLRYLMPIFTGRLDSLTDVAGSGKAARLKKKIAGIKKKIVEIAEVSRPAGSRFERKPSIKLEKQAAGLIPLRKVWGSYGLARVPDKIKQERKLEFSSWSYDNNVPIFWADGKNTIFDIQWLVGQEMGKTPDLDYLLTLFRTLEEFGYFELKKG
ncbi:MAG: M28 family peptidase [Candidatus Glassbacteria bacterium]